MTINKAVKKLQTVIDGCDKNSSECVNTENDEFVEAQSYLLLSTFLMFVCLAVSTVVTVHAVNIYRQRKYKTKFRRFLIYFSVLNLWNCIVVCLLNGAQTLFAFNQDIAKLQGVFSTLLLWIMIAFFTINSSVLLSWTIIPLFYLEVVLTYSWHKNKPKWQTYYNKYIYTIVFSVNAFLYLLILFFYFSNIFSREISSKVFLISYCIEIVKVILFFSISFYWKFKYKSRFFTLLFIFVNASNFIQVGVKSCCLNTSEITNQTRMHSICTNLIGR